MFAINHSLSLKSTACAQIALSLLSINVKQKKTKMHFSSLFALIVEKFPTVSWHSTYCKGYISRTCISIFGFPINNPKYKRHWWCLNTFLITIAQGCPLSTARICSNAFISSHGYVTATCSGSHVIQTILLILAGQGFWHVGWHCCKVWVHTRRADDDEPVNKQAHLSWPGQ